MEWVLRFQKTQAHWIRKSIVSEIHCLALSDIDIYAIHAGNYVWMYKSGHSAIMPSTTLPFFFSFVPFFLAPLPSNSYFFQLLDSRSFFSLHGETVKWENRKRLGLDVSHFVEQIKTIFLLIVSIEHALAMHTRWGHDFHDTLFFGVFRFPYSI